MTPIALAIFGVAVLSAVCVPWAMLYRARGRVAAAVLEASKQRGLQRMLAAEANDLSDDKERLQEVIDDLNERRRKALVAARRCSEPGAALDSLELLLGEDETNDPRSTETSGELPETATPTPSWADPDDTV